MNSIIFKRDVILDACDRAYPIAAKDRKPINDSSNKFLLERRGEDAVLTATSMSSGEMAIIKMKFEECDATSDFKYSIDAKKLREAIKLIPSDTIEMNFDDSIVSLPYGNGQMKLPYYDTDYPEIQESPGKEFTVNADFLLSNMRKSRSFAGTDELRPVLCGMSLMVKDGRIEVAATDAMRLFVNGDTFEDKENDTTVVIPSSVIESTLDLFDCKQELKMSCSAKYAYFSSNGGETILRFLLMESKYPNYESIIPKENEISVIASIADFRNALRKCEWSADDVSKKVVKLSIKDNTITFRAESHTYSTLSDETIPCESGETELGISFIVDALETCIDALSGDRFTMKFKDNSHSAILFDDDSPLQKIIIMPCEVIG